MCIVDDETKVRESLALLLSTADIESETYASAEEFLASFSSEEPACIILDNQLPGVSGLDLIRRFSKSSIKPAVIMITGYADVPTAVEAMKVGAFHFIEKPFDAEALLAAVEEALEAIDQVRDLQLERQVLRARSALLTQREQEVLALLVEGLPNKAVASRLGISARTAEHHRSVVMQKMQARTISHLVRMAISFELVEPSNNQK